MINQYLFHYLLNSCAYFGNKTISLELTQSLSNLRFVCKNVGQYFCPCLVSKMSAAFQSVTWTQRLPVWSEGRRRRLRTVDPSWATTWRSNTWFSLHHSLPCHRWAALYKQGVPQLCIPPPPTYSHVVRFTQSILRTSNIPHHATLNFEVHERVKMMFLK